MDRYNVASSNILSIGYDQPTMTLEVEFLNGRIYQYYNVPENMYDEIMKTPSKGRFLHAYIRNAYPYSQVG